MPMPAHDAACTAKLCHPNLSLIGLAHINADSGAVLSVAHDMPRSRFLNPAGQVGSMRAAPASQQDSSVAPANRLGGPPAGMPGIPGGTASPLDWALHAVAAASSQQQRPRAAVPVLAHASAPAVLHTASASAAADRQGHQQPVQHTSAAAAAHQRSAQQRRAEASTAPAARLPQHPQGESCAAFLKFDSVQYSLLHEIRQVQLAQRRIKVGCQSELFSEVLRTLCSREGCCTAGREQGKLWGGCQHQRSLTGHC